MSRGCENYMMHTKLYFSKLNSLKLYFSHCIFPNCIFPYCIFPKGIFLKFTCQTIYWSNRNKNMYIISPAKRMPHNRFYSKFFGNNLEIKHATLYKHCQRYNGPRHCFYDLNYLSSYKAGKFTRKENSS